MSAFPKPARRGPRPKRRIVRRVHVKRTSMRRGQVVKADREWAQAVKERDRGRCVQCGHTMTDAHHVFGKKAYPRLRHDRENGIALCRLHHDLWHRMPYSHLIWFMTEYARRYSSLCRKAREAA